MKIRDLLAESVTSSNLHVDSPDLFAGLVQEKVENPLDFSRILKAAFNARGNDISKLNVSHLYGLNLILLNLLYSFVFVIFMVLGKRVLNGANFWLFDLTSFGCGLR